MPPSVNPVLDASALICLARCEPGWQRVAEHGISCDLSAVNLVEVAYRLSAHGMPLEAVESIVRPIIGRVVPFDDQQAMIAAGIHAKTRDGGLSLADCACLALAISRNAAVITADKKWKTLKLGIEIVQIR